jgi:hypothetical protein
MRQTISRRGCGFGLKSIASFACTFLLVAGLSLPANAATISLSVQALSASDSNLVTSNPSLVTNPASTGTSLDATAGPVSPASGVGGTSYANSFADIATGELKAKAETVVSNAAQEAANLAVATAQIIEQFQVTGNGTVFAFLALDGSYDVSNFNSGTPGFAIQANLSFGSVSGFIGGITNDFLQINGTTGPYSGTINHELASQANVGDGTVFTLTAFLLAQIHAGTHGTIDLSNTATLFLVASNGVTLTPADSRFLENPAYSPSEVPLPAALPLFLGGAALLGFLGRRRKKPMATRAA